MTNASVLIILSYNIPQWLLGMHLHMVVLQLRGQGISTYKQHEKLLACCIWIASTLDNSILMVDSHGKTVSPCVCVCVTSEIHFMLDISKS